MRTIDELSLEAPAETSRHTPREFDILDVLLILAARKSFIALLSIIGFVLGIVIVLTVAPSYTAKAWILPPEQQQSSSSALMGQFGALASITGMGSGLGLKNPVDLFIGVLQSQTVGNAMIKRFDLMRVLHAKNGTQARYLLQKNSRFVAEKDGMISIAVDAGDPHRAADMANAYVDELYKLNNRLALGGASQKRLFFEQQLAQEKDRLADSEVALKETEEKTGVIAPTGQTETIIRQVAQLQADITSREVQLDALRTSSTNENPDVVRLNTELSGLRRELRDLESGSNSRSPGDISISTKNVPQAGLEYIRKERDVKYHQLLFDLLARQYEAARMDEAKAAPIIQIVDPALVPEKKSAPFRALWAITGGVLGFLISCGWVLSKFIYGRIAADKEQGIRLAMLRQELKLRG